MQSDLARTGEAYAYGPLDEAYRPDVGRETTVAGALVEALADWGVQQAFGIIGGAIGVLFDAIEESTVDCHHFRHESGAAFAAVESYFASGAPTILFMTTGPGLLNALTGIAAARWDGAKVILLSGTTGPQQRGRWATQETSAYTLPQDGIYSAGTLFDFAVRIESAAELPAVLRRLQNGIARPGGFVAHVALPISLQSTRVDIPRQRKALSIIASTPTSEALEQCAKQLLREPFVVWLGHGARGAAPQVRELVARTGARVMASPRAKGIFAENDPHYLGVTGIGGHDGPARFMLEQRPSWTLVLGTRLGEATSYWESDLIPAKGFIHVDLDPEVPGAAFPEVETIGIQAEIGAFLDALLEHIPEPERSAVPASIGVAPEPAWATCQEPVRPQALMHALQRRVVQGTDAVVMAECGNSFAWCNHYLRFSAPGRYRTSASWGSMGHCAAGVVGAALGRRKKAWAVVGDGSMLMNCEISTAVQYRVPAVWVVLNDSGYGMCENGQRVLGLAADDLTFPTVDFVAMARAMGADGVSVRSEDMLDVALEQALEADGPFVVDVYVDRHQRSPLMPRFESLLKQGSAKSVAGWAV